MTIMVAVVVAGLLHSQALSFRSEAQKQPPEPGRTLSPYFTPASPDPKSVDSEGFLRRWLLLEPVNKPSRTNTNLTSTYVRDTVYGEFSADQLTAVPHDGDRAAVVGQDLAWHALDSANFNVKLFRFAYGLKKPTYGIVCWAVTVVNCPRQFDNVRLAVGSNSASVWWLNGKETVDLFNDRHMIVDDVVSGRITLNKGRNVLRGAVINGPGLSDFCVRFIDENGNPIKDIATSLEPQ